MSRSTRSLSLMFVSVALLSVAGCTKPALDGFSGERGEVSGTVTLDDAPLQAGCQVLFMSKAGGYTAAGVIGDQGKYTLKYTVSAGVPAGDYLVQLAAPAEAVSTESVDPVKMADAMKLNRKTAAATGDDKPFPRKYLATTSSGLSFKVEPGKNTADFPLTTAAKK
jgi:hypothetical protein